MTKSERDRMHWCTWGHTSILLYKDETNLIPEWQPVGQLMLRQIYEGKGKQWHAWAKDDNGLLGKLVGIYDDWLDAQSAVENATGYTSPDKDGRGEIAKNTVESEEV